MIWHLNELELLVAFRENAFRENAPSSAAAVGAAVKAVEIAPISGAGKAMDAPAAGVLVSMACRSAVAALCTCIC